MVHKIDEQKELLARQEQELEIEKQKLEKENDFFHTWERIINSTKTKEGLPITEGTKRSKKQTLELVIEHCAKYKIRLTFENLDKMYYHDLDNYMITKSFSPNNRGKHFKEVKAILREAEDRDINVNPAFHKKSFKVIRMASDSIYLNDEDIGKLLDAKLSPAKRIYGIFSLWPALLDSAIPTGINSGKKTSSGKMEKIFCGFPSKREGRLFMFRCIQSSRPY